MPSLKTPALLCLLSIACGGSPEPTPRQAAGPPGTGPAYSVAHPSAEAEERAADFRGSCAFARPPGRVEDYRLTLRAKESVLGAVRVRSRAIFDAAERDHLLGEIPSGTVLRAAGPVRAGAGREGMGYAVLIRDSVGRVCRGYVSRALLERQPR